MDPTTVFAAYLASISASPAFIRAYGNFSESFHFMLALEASLLVPLTSLLIICSSIAPVATLEVLMVELVEIAIQRRLLKLKPRLTDHTATMTMTAALVWFSVKGMA
jgi:hypothetical protein